MTRVIPATRRVGTALLAAGLLGVLAARSTPPAAAQGQPADPAPPATAAAPTEAAPRAEPGAQDTSILRVGEDVRIESGEVVDGNVTVLFADLVVEQDGEIAGDAVVVLGDLFVDGIVGGDVTASGDLTLGEQGRIDGNATVLGELVGDEGAIGGRLVVPDGGRNLRPIPGQVSMGRAELTTQQRVGYGLTSVAVGTLVAMLLVALTRLVAPTATARVSRGIATAPAASFALGCSAWLILPLVLLAVAITIIGIPIVLIGWLLLLLLGWTALSALLGGRLLGGSRSLAATVLGAFILSILVNLVSVLGWRGLCAGSLLGFVLTAAPLGAALRTGFGTRWWPSAPLDESPPPDEPPAATGDQPPPALDSEAPPAADQSSSPEEPGPMQPTVVPESAESPVEPAPTLPAESPSGSSAPPAAAASTAQALGAPSAELTQVPGITPVYALLLRQAGITDLSTLAGATSSHVVEVASPPGVTPIELSTAERWIETATLLLRGEGS